MARIPAEGKHKLTLKDVKEIPSKARPGDIYYEFVFETEGGSIVRRAISPHTYTLIKDMVDILWPWYGRRIGKSIHEFDFDKLKGRSGDFYIHWETYRGEDVCLVDTRSKR